MLLNYFKIAFRSLLKFKGYATINLLGLALGFSAGILIMIYALDELSYDSFHNKSDRIYRVETTLYTPSTGDSKTMDANGWGVGVTLKNYPEVEAVLYTRNASSLLINHAGKRIRQQIHFASPEFFSIFSFPLVKGNAEKALTEPYSIVITEAMEKKYFPGQDALNKTLILADTVQCLVTGVMKDIPSNSHIQLDMLLSFSTFPIFNPGFDYNDGWGNINLRNYVLLKEGSDASSFAAKARNIYHKRAGQMLKEWGVDASVGFAPLNKIYLTTTCGNGMGPVGSIQRVYLVSGIALFVIILACINFINLTTARSVYRAKEVGLRKVVGSTRPALIRQFLSESFVLSVMAFIIAIALTGLMLPLFNQLLAKNYTISVITTLPVITGIVALVVLITFLSGYYPAWMMSGMRPVEVLKGKLHTQSKGVRLRRVLVVFQFAISVSLVLGTFIVLDQLKYMQKQDLGFAKDEIFVVNAARVSSPNPNAHETFKTALRSLTVVDEVTYSNALPGSPGWTGQIAYPEGKTGDDAISVEYMAVDEDYIKTLGLQLIAGREFSREREADQKDGLIINEKAMSMFGWFTPEEAVGKRITSPSGHPAGEVIGVVKDYHQLGLQQGIGPMVMDVNPTFSYLYAVRYKAADTQELIAQLEPLWKKHFPGYDFNYFFLNENFAKQYQAEQRLATVFALFAVITIVIAAIGLLGLVSFIVVSKTKEIGVRKVLGADVLNIASLLSKEFVILVVIANAIAFPLVWYLTTLWLENFANKIDINPLLFLITLLLAVTVTIATISFQTIKAALVDPVQSLRYE
jgi:putative ABC transport system permease protein